MRYRPMFGPDQELRLGDKLRDFSWGLLLLLLAVGCIGFAVLYSAAGGRLDPWASRQMMVFGGGLLLMVCVALLDVRIWLRTSWLFYSLGVLMLVYTDFFGRTAMGATRWIDLGFIRLQPSEVMKIALVLTLANYFHGLSEEESAGWRGIFPPLAIIGLPVALVMVQPDLGTAMMLLMIGAAIMFLAGVPWWLFAGGAAAAAAAAPILYTFLHDYQKKRVLIFLNPEQDPLGAGYHILQSKIALGSGGVFGKGFLEGTQGHLSFLPEKHTDFIFTSLAEEMGLVGGVGLIGLYLLIVAYGFAIAVRSSHQFGRLLAGGVASMMFIYMFINVAMISGLVPVVGVPLPLVSYGGTSMLTLLIAFGMVMSVYIHRDLELPRRHI
jgi:rod shape determining protein RodA